MSLQVLFAAHIPLIVPVERINNVVFFFSYILHIVLCRENSECKQSDFPKGYGNRSHLARKIKSGKTEKRKTEKGIVGSR